MGNFISNRSFNHLILCCTLGTFTFTTVAPLNAMHGEQVKVVNLNDVNFAVRLEKLIEKSKKYFGARDSIKLREVMFDIKHEIEGYTGKKIDLDKQLDQIEKEAKSRGQPVDKTQMKVMRKRLKKEEKRFEHKALYMTNCLEYGLPYNPEEEEILYEVSLSDYLHEIENNVKGQKKDNRPLA